MIAAGVEPLYRSESLAVVGLTEVVRHLPRLRRVMGGLNEALADADLCLTIDYPGFNIRLARRARKRGVPTVHYIAPTVWAWGRGRIRKVRRSVDRLAVIFDFEETLWKDAGVDAAFVGNPLVDEAPALLSSTELRGLVPGVGDYVALLPGSRPQEIERLYGAMLEGAAHIHASHPRLHFVVPLATGLPPVLLEDPARASGLPITVIPGHARSILAHAQAAVVASGTAATEAALVGVPHVIVYRVSPVTWAVGRALVDLEHLGIPSIILGREVAPELLQSEMTPSAIAAALVRLIDDAQYRKTVEKGLAEATRRLGTPGAAERTARIVVDLLGVGKCQGT